MESGDKNIITPGGKPEMGNPSTFLEMGELRLGSAGSLLVTITRFGEGNGSLGCRKHS